MQLTAATLVCLHLRQTSQGCSCIQRYGFRDIFQMHIHLVIEALINPLTHLYYVYHYPPIMSVINNGLRLDYIIQVGHFHHFMPRYCSSLNCFAVGGFLFTVFFGPQPISSLACIHRINIIFKCHNCQFCKSAVSEPERLNQSHLPLSTFSWQIICVNLIHFPRRKLLYS